MIYKTLILLLLNIQLLYGYININIDATGLFVPYSLGILGYIKKNENIDNYKLTGISGGSWASIIYHFEKDLSDPEYIWDMLVGKDDNYEIRLDKNLDKFQQIVKNNMLEKYKHITDEEIKNVPISIIVSRIDNCKIKNEKINKFNNLNHLIDMCICSSYLPYISGNTFTKKYNGTNYIDGAILKNINHFNCVDKCEKNINIHRTMWGRNFDLLNYFYLNKDISTKLFIQGWDDTKNYYK